MPVDRNRMRSGLQNRTKESYDRRDDSGRFKSIFENRSGLPMMKLKDDEHLLNIVPYIAGEMNPIVKKGDPAYCLDLWVHRGVGPSEDQYVCMLRTFKNRPGMRCAICEHQVQLKKVQPESPAEAKKLSQEIKSLNPTRRAVYNAELVTNNTEAEKGIQILDISHFLFEKELASLAKLPRGGGFVYFSDPDDPQTISFTKKTAQAKTESGATQTVVDFSSWRFIPRGKPYSDELLAKAYCLEDLIHWPSYEEVYGAFHQQAPDEERGGEDADTGADDDVPFEKGQEQPADRTPAPTPDPPPTASTPAAQPSSDVARSREYRCPNNATFGKDNRTLPECGSCRLLEPCDAKFKELQPTQAPPPPAAATPPPANPPAPPPPPSSGGLPRRRPGR